MMRTAETPVSFASRSMEFCHRVTTASLIEKPEAVKISTSFIKDDFLTLTLEKVFSIVNSHFQYILKKLKVKLR